MDLEKRIKLIRTLQQKSNEGQIPWEKTNSKNAFQVIFPNSSIKIIQDEENFSNIYFLIIFNSEGNITDNLSRNNLEEKFPDVNVVLEEIYQTARARSLKADDTIDEILKDLE